MKKLLAIGFIWLGCAIAWMILGSTILVRSGESSSELLGEVNLLWGPPMEQAPPTAVYVEARQERETVRSTDAEGRTVQKEVVRVVDHEVEIPLEQSDIAVKLALQHRQKGLLWFATYGVDFKARYRFVNQTSERRAIEFRFPLGAHNAVYDGFQVTAPEGKPVGTAIANGLVHWKGELAPGEARAFAISYRSRGTSRWHYQLTAGTGQVRGFHLRMDTDFSHIDFPAGTLSPSEHHVVGSGWQGDWSFQSLVANAPIGIELPQRLNPGPLASRITYFAPVGLLFFFFVVAVFAMARGLHIHPLNYFFFGCAFFAFHLLFGYLVDHLAIFPAFGIASAVSILLVVSYARLFVGWGFALREMGFAQLLYLVLFSFTFFWQGFTGLAITVGAILTLFVMMQFTGRKNWNEAGGAGAIKPI